MNSKLTGENTSQASKKLGSHIAHQDIPHRVENVCTLLSNLVQTAPGRVQPRLRQLSEADAHLEGMHSH